uniref:Secreted protein n=1 Tax=Globodera rostochiensis TaxID=31243 RepID=A0A914HGR5_GLORO
MKLIVFNYCIAFTLWLRYSAYGKAELRWREKRQVSTGTLSPLGSGGSCQPLTVPNGIVNYLPIGIAQNSLIGGTAQPAGTTANNFN